MNTPLFATLRCASPTSFPRKRESHIAPSRYPSPTSFPRKREAHIPPLRYSSPTSFPRKREAHIPPLRYSSSCSMSMANPSCTPFSRMERAMFSEKPPRFDPEMTMFTSTSPPASSRVRMISSRS